MNAGVAWIRRYLLVIAGVVFAFAAGSALLRSFAPPAAPDPFVAETGLSPIPERAPRAATTSAVSKRTVSVAEALELMQGCWRGSRTDGTEIDERYVLDPNGALVGRLVETRPDGLIVFFEDMRIVQASDGIRYFPAPRGRPSAVSFRLTTWDQRHAEFTAPEHDFPQRIAYASDGDWLATVATGVVDGRPKSDEYRTARVVCAPG